MRNLNKVDKNTRVIFGEIWRDNLIKINLKWNSVKLPLVLYIHASNNINILNNSINWNNWAEGCIVSKNLLEGDMIYVNNFRWK